LRRHTLAVASRHAHRRSKRPLVRWVDAFSPLAPLYDWHLERRARVQHARPWTTLPSHKLPHDCLHFCMHGAVWDPLVVSVLAS